MPSKASASWKGGLKDGTGTYTASSGAFSEVPYTFAQRFEGKPGSNPEELIAAAHAACFAMALSSELEKRGMKAERLDATATVTLEKDTVGMKVGSSHLDLAARVPGADRAKFEEAAHAAETGCPISKLLNAKITLEARLV